MKKLLSLDCNGIIYQASLFIAFILLEIAEEKKQTSFQSDKKWLLAIFRFRIYDTKHASQLITTLACFK